jgi:hypothetical protein
MNQFVAGLLAGLAAVAVIAGGAYATYLWWIQSQKNSDAKIRMLSKQYRAMTDSASRDIPMDVLGRPDLISSRMEFRKIEAIESELTGDGDRGMAQKLLTDFFKMDDPWVKARAAKALYPLDSKTAIGQLHALAKSSSPFVQIPGVWALGELKSDRALEILMSMVWAKNAEVQQSVIRSLVQKETRRQIPPEYARKVKNLLREVRYKTDWVL